jgi:hypothetical protein
MEFTVANLNLRLKNVGTKYYLELFGKLNEDTNFSKVDLTQATEIVANFKNVTQIQSCGVREWIKLIKPYSNIPFIFLNCPKAVIDQINMVDGFLPKNGKVESFYVPYFSETNGSTMNVLFRFGSDFDLSGVLRYREIKDSEGNSMAIDVVEHKYFRFLNQNKSAYQIAQNKLSSFPFSTSA